MLSTSLIPASSGRSQIDLQKALLEKIEEFDLVSEIGSFVQPPDIPEFQKIAPICFEAILNRQLENAYTKVSKERKWIYPAMQEVGHYSYQDPTVPSTSPPVHLYPILTCTGNECIKFVNDRFAIKSKINSSHERIIIMNADTGHVYKELSGHPDTIKFSPEGQKMMVTEVDLAWHRLAMELPYPHERNRFTPTVYICDTSDWKKPVQAFHKVANARFHSDKTLIIHFLEDRRIEIWDMEQWRLQNSFKGHGCCLSPDGKITVIEEPHFGVQIIDQDNKSLSIQGGLGENLVFRIHPHFSHDGNSLLIPLNQRLFQIWDTQKREFTHTLDLNTLYKEKERIKSIYFSSDSSKVIIHTDVHILIFDLIKGEFFLSPELRETHRENSNHAWSSDGKILLLSCPNHTLRIVDELKEAFTLDHIQWDEENSPAFEPSGRMLWIPFQDEKKSLRILDTKTWSFTNQIFEDVHSFALHPNGQFLAIFTSNALQIWNLTTGSLVMTQKRTRKERWSDWQKLKFSSSGKNLLIQGHDEKVMEVYLLWEDRFLAVIADPSNSDKRTALLPQYSELSQKKLFRKAIQLIISKTYSDIQSLNRTGWGNEVPDYCEERRRAILKMPSCIRATEAITNLIEELQTLSNPRKRPRDED